MSIAAAATAPRFSTPSFTPGTKGEMLIVTDVTGDAIPDVAVLDGTCKGIVVLPGNGDGNFARPVVSCGGFFRGLLYAAVADVNSDSRTDIVTEASGERGPISIWINDGGGRFHRAGVYRSSPWASGLAAADVNADGIIDLVTQNPARRELVVLLGTGDGGFGAPLRFTGDATRDPASGGFGSVAVGDVNGDGKPDALLFSRLALVRLGNGDGTFGPERRFGRAEFGESVTLADLNHDSKLDVVAALFESTTVTFLGNGDGTFGAMARYITDPGQFLVSVQVADFDGDGNTDMAAMSLGDGSDLFVRLGVGNGTFGALREVRIARGAYDGPFAADFNRDGRPDLAYLAQPAHTRGGVSVSLNWSGLSTAPCVPGYLVRKPLRSAKRSIQRAGCRLGRVRYRHSRTVRNGRVVSQRPLSGAVRPHGTRVNLVASRGPHH